MTRKIDYKAAEALESGKRFKQSNTLVEDNAMYLHGHKIAWIENGSLYISLCGYNTQTTRSRLNGLNGVSVCSKNFQPYLNGEKIESTGIYKID